MSRLKLLASVVAAGLLAGCATTSPPRVAVVPANGAAVDPAKAYMQRVETTARRRGIGVIWVNPPTRNTIASQ